MKFQPKCRRVDDRIEVRTFDEARAVLAAGGRPLIVLTPEQEIKAQWRLPGRPPGSRRPPRKHRPRGRPPKMTQLEQVWASIPLRDKVYAYADKIISGELKPDPGPRRREDGTFDEPSAVDNMLAKPGRYDHYAGSGGGKSRRNHKRPICIAKRCVRYLKKADYLVCSLDCAEAVLAEKNRVLTVLKPKSQLCREIDHKSSIIE